MANSVSLACCERGGNWRFFEASPPAAKTGIPKMGIATCDISFVNKQRIHTTSNTPCIELCATTMHCTTARALRLAAWLAVAAWLVALPCVTAGGDHGGPEVADGAWTGVHGMLGGLGRG